MTRQAQLHQVSRQTVYNNAPQVQEAIQVEHSDGPSREQLLRENQELRHENGQLWDWLNQTIEFPRHKQQEFGVLAIAMGLSLSQIADLLALILGTQAAPGRSTVDRWGLAAEAAAGKVLKRLDEHCKGLVTTACLDETFFHGRPVFVGVEPRSMTLILADKGGSAGPCRLAEEARQAGTPCGMSSAMRGLSSNRPSPGWRHDVGPRGPRCR